MTRWITADWHLGEDRFRLMQRPFTDAQVMIDTLVENHNSLVDPDDEVLVVGDIVNQKTPEFFEQVSRFNGKKILFRGNHDRVFTDEQLLEHFEEVIDERTGRYYTLDNNGEELDVYVNHYPTESKYHCFNLVGHIHSAWKVQLNALNVGVDAHHFRPINMDEDVPFFYTAITKFYDDDVWVAYHPSQQSYALDRRKRGRYLDVDGFVGGEK